MVFLSNRMYVGSFCVKNKNLSVNITYRIFYVLYIKFGVPHGIILNPLRFIIRINGLKVDFNNKPNCVIIYIYI